MRVSVCIPAMRADTLPAAIGSVRRQTRGYQELLVVVQGTSPAALPVAERELRGEPRARIVAIPSPGASRARNAAFDHAAGDVLAMMDDDCEAAPGWLGALVGCLEDDPGAGLASGALLPPRTARGGLSVCPTLIPTEARYDPRDGRPVPAGWDWVSANFAIRRSVIDRVGHFDEHLGAGTEFGSAEELDYKLRLEQLGIPMRSTPRAAVTHTYGTRAGLLAVLRHHRHYARGFGAMAGKLSLLGDPRGEAFLEGTLRTWQEDLGSPRRLHRAPQHLRRWLHARRAYQQVLRRYRLDSRGLLIPREGDPDWQDPPRRGVSAGRRA